MKTYFSHKTSIIEKQAKVGKNTKIWHYTHIEKTAEIGSDCNIGQNCYVAGKVGNHCRLQNNVNLYLGVEIGDFVFCGPSMTFTNDLTPRVKYPKHGNYEKTIVHEGVSLGANSTIVCGITIGKWAFIGAGSVVTKDIPAYALVYGNPARIQGWICECGTKLANSFVVTKCKSCKRQYKKKGNDIVVI